MPSHNKREEDHRRKREIKLPQTKNRYENPIIKTPNQHTQSIIQKEEEEEKNNEKVSTPKIKLIHLFYYYFINLKYISVILSLFLFIIK